LQFRIDYPSLTTLPPYCFVVLAISDFSISFRERLASSWRSKLLHKRDTSTSDATYNLVSSRRPEGVVYTCLICRCILFHRILGIRTTSSRLIHFLGGSAKETRWSQIMDAPSIKLFNDGHAVMNSCSGSSDIQTASPGVRHPDFERWQLGRNANRCA
jgi:hypothetical protein